MNRFGRKLLLLLVAWMANLSRADDREKFQKAIDRADPGAIIGIPAGDYKFEQPLQVSRPCVIDVAGRVRCDEGFAVVTADDVTITGTGRLTMLRDWSRPSPRQRFNFIVYAKGAKRFTVERLAIGLSVKGTTDKVSTAGCVLIQDGEGEKEASQDFAVRDLRIVVSSTQPSTDQRTFAVLIWSRHGRPVENGIVTQNAIVGGGTRGIETVAARNIAITNNVIRGAGTPVDCPSVRIIATQNLTISGNAISDEDPDAGERTGITLGGHGGYSPDQINRNITITGNAISSMAKSGSGIIVRGDPGGGEYPSGGARGIVISGNTIAYRGKAEGDLNGIRVLTHTSPVTDVLITGNHVDGWPRAQIAVDAGKADPDRITIADNMLHGKVPVKTNKPIRGVNVQQ